MYLFIANLKLNNLATLELEYTKSNLANENCCFDKCQARRI